MQTVVPTRALARACALVLALAPFSSRADEPAAAAAAPVDVAIVQPGAPGSPKAAAGFLAELSKYLEKKTGLATVTATYQNRPKPALAALKERSARVAVVSPGFYLEHRRTLGLEVVLEALPRQRFYLLVPKGSGRTAADLAGQVVAGGALYEPRYLERIVFPAGKAANGADSGGKGPAAWKGKPTTRTSTALYQLGKGRVAAVVVDGRDYASLEKLGRLKNLEIARQSDYYPLAFVVLVGRCVTEKKAKGDPPTDAARATQTAAGGRPPSDEQKRIIAAFDEMAEDPAARTLLKTMGCEEFERIRKPWLEELQKRFGHAEEKQKK